MNTTNEVDNHDLHIDLQCIKEELATTVTINQLDMADGLKQLLVSKSFALRLLMDKLVVWGLAKMFSTDNYVHYS
jgi:hypothetical protein